MPMLVQIAKDRADSRLAYTHSTGQVLRDRRIGSPSESADIWAALAYLAEQLATKRTKRTKAALENADDR